MNHTIKLTVIILFTILIVNTSKVHAILFPAPAKVITKNSVTIFGEQMPNYESKYVRVGNIGDNGLGYFYTKFNSEYCIINSIKYQKCKRVNSTKGFQYLENKKFYFKENTSIYGPYESEESLMNDIEDKGIIYIKKYENKNDSYEFINDISGNFIKKDGKLFGPYTDKDILNTTDFTVTLDDGEYAYVNGKLIGPYFRISLKDYGDNGILIRYITNLKNGDYKTGEVYHEIGGKKYGPINMKNTTDFEIMDLGENGIGIKTVKEGKKYLEINGTLHGPYDVIRRVIDLGKNGVGIDYAVEINPDSFAQYGYAQYIEINGKTYGPYTRTTNSSMFGKLSNNGYYFEFDTYGNKYGTSYININGVEYGPYIGVEDIQDLGVNGIMLTYIPSNSTSDYNNKSFIINNLVKKNRGNNNLLNSSIKNKIDTLVEKSSKVKLEKLNNKLLKINFQNTKYEEIFKYLQNKINEKLD